MAVIIKDTDDDRIEIVYCRPNSLQASVLNVPKYEFLEACTEFADKVASSAKSNAVTTAYIPEAMKKGK